MNRTGLADRELHRDALNNVQPGIRRWLGGIRRNAGLYWLGLAIAVVALISVAAPLITPYGPQEEDLGSTLQSPSRDHWAGTDQSGRDVLTRTIHAGRISLSVGFGVALLGSTLAALVGGLSGFAGGKVDSVIQRVVDAFLSIPALILLMTVLTVLGTSVTKIIVVIAVWSMVASSRTIRSAVLSVRERPFISAARVIGASQLRIFFRHILPNVMAPIIVVASLVFGYAILIEATLSFLGFGVSPPTPTWGGMLAGDTRTYMVSAPWLAIVPGAALTTVVIIVNLFGDSLRDALDPSLRGRR